MFVVAFLGANASKPSLGVPILRFHEIILVTLQEKFDCHTPVVEIMGISYHAFLAKVWKLKNFSAKKILREINF